MKAKENSEAPNKPDPDKVKALVEIMNVHIGDIMALVNTRKTRNDNDGLDPDDMGSELDSDDE